MLRDALLPPSQVREVDQLLDDLDHTSGDATSKSSAFWTMLVLSAVIAAAGVLSDSTATVIGAMIIAPLSTPIMGIALGVSRRSGSLTGASLRYVVLGGSLVVLIGVLAAWLTPGDANLFTNGQITGRTSPGLLDLLAAVATGAAGSIALTRKDVAAVLPGVAIAISLVPPLVVVGVCLGQGSVGLALGALVLFLSNVVALVLVGTLVFSFAGYGADASVEKSSKLAYFTIAGVLGLVLIPLAANTIGSYVTSLWTARVESSAKDWATQTPGTTVDGVELVGDRFYIDVRTPGALPATQTLADQLTGQIPSGLSIVVRSTVGLQSAPVAVGVAAGS